jgi:hypothetical protein
MNEENCKPIRQDTMVVIRKMNGCLKDEKFKEISPGLVHREPNEKYRKKFHDLWKCVYGINKLKAISTFNIQYDA